MPEHVLGDPLLIAVRNARPVIDDAVLQPTSDEALKMLEHVLSGEHAPALTGAGDRGRIRTPRRTPVRRILRPRLGAFATAAAAAAAVIVLVVSGLSGSRSLVDRAYAAVNVSNDVLHEVDLRSVARDDGFYERVEGWLQPGTGRTRVIEISGSRASTLNLISEWIVTSRGRVFHRVCLTGCRPRKFLASRRGWSDQGVVPPGTFGGPPEVLPGTFARWFGTAYRNRAVVADGTATFAGRRVARFESMATLLDSVTFWRPGTPRPATSRGHGSVLINWYVDPATAQPVGYTVLDCPNGQTRTCGAAVDTVRIASFQRLKPTAQNLALLSGPNAPRGAR
jgi:hypothetical protein